MKRLQRLISIILTAVTVICLALTLGTSTSAKDINTAEISADSVTSNQAYGLSQSIEGSQILHCWCWSFNTIKNEIPNIAAAGFSAIQTSPISECKVGENGGLELMGNGKWYYHYQPTDYKIGNYQLGTLDEFIEMCKVADEYSVKVIADAVVNHTTSDRSVISENILNIEGEALHNNGGLSNFNDRECTTQQDLLGLCDLNTQNPNVQKYILDFLTSCVKAGASGFRYDAAKHIELPSDDEKYASDFWPVVLNNGSEFQYGEILQGGADKYTEYAELMHVVTSSYGATLRGCLINREVPAESLYSYQSDGVSADRLVPWVESHDNYCGDNTWSYISKEDTILGWAIIGSREGTTPLFFARPDGSTSSDPWGKNQIGIAGDGTYYCESVTAVNHFKNEMAGESEKLSNPNGNKSLIMVERGTKGAVIVNVSDEDVAVNAVSVLADGKYTDQVSHDTFEVKDGLISGTVAKRSVAVVYNSEFSYPARITFSYTDEIIHDGIELTVSADNSTLSYYTVNNSDGVVFSDSVAIDLSSYKQGDSITVTVYADNEKGDTTSKSYTYTKIDTPIYNCDTAVYFNNVGVGFDTVYAYVYRNIDGSVEQNYQWPGIPMNKLMDNFYGYVLPDWENMCVIFNDGNNVKITDNGSSFTVNHGEQKLYSFGEFSDYITNGEQLNDTTKSFYGDEYIYFDPSSCSWFANDKAIAVIRLDDNDFEEMEQFTTEDGRTLWRYLPDIGKYSHMTIARQVGVSIYNAYTTVFDGSKDLYVSGSNWKNGGVWTYLYNEPAETTAPTTESQSTAPTESLTPTDPTGTVNPSDNTSPTDASEAQATTAPTTASALETKPTITVSTETIATETNVKVHTTETTYPIEIQILYGDADQNGKVNVKDATLIQKHLADIYKLEGQALICADVNRDDTINIKDATIIQKFVAGLAEKLG